MQSDLDRRTFFLAAGATTATISAVRAEIAAPMLDVKPLTIDPKGIAGLSEKLIVSHHENNYAGAVRRFNAISAELKALDFAKAPVFTINGLKREQLMAGNSAVLHELFFASLGSGGAAAGEIAAALARDFGSVDAWRAEFAGIGKALGGGSGWVLLTWSPRLKRLVNQWAADHTMTMADGMPILALDMYEHAYHMDFGAKAGAYVDAFMAVIDWSGAAARYDTVRKAMG